MREINKTIYDILKMVDPNDDISVTQLITDEVVKKSTSGEIKAGDKDDATGVLDLKAFELGKKKEESTSTNIKRQVKASGKTVRNTSEATGSKKSISVSKKPPNKTNRKSSGTTTRRVVKVSSEKKNTENNSLTKIILLIVVLAIAGYLYTQLQ